MADHFLMANKAKMPEKVHQCMASIKHFLMYTSYYLTFGKVESS